MSCLWIMLFSSSWCCSSVQWQLCTRARTPTQKYLAAPLQWGYDSDSGTMWVAIRPHTFLNKLQFAFMQSKWNQTSYNSREYCLMKILKTFSSIFYFTIETVIDNLFYPLCSRYFRNELLCGLISSLLCLFLHGNFFYHSNHSLHTF